MLLTSRWGMGHAGQHGLPEAPGQMHVHCLTFLLIT